MGSSGLSNASGAASTLNPGATGSTLTLNWAGTFIGWMGDSISLSSTTNAPAQYASALRGVVNWAISGATFVAVGNLLTEYSLNHLNETRLVIEGGVDDLASDITAATLLPVVLAFVDARLAEGKQVVLNNIGPWAGYSGSSGARQTQTTVYNASLAAALVSRPRVKPIDLQALMGDPGNPGFLLPAYNSGDGIHPNATAGAAWAAAVAAVAP